MRLVLAMSLALAQAATTFTVAQAASASGPSALALAGVVAEHSSVLGSFDKRAVRRLFDGHSNIGFPPNRKISVKAETVSCRASDVDITSRSCELVFGPGKRHLTGRQANEVFATLAAAGVASEGAAGSINEAIKNLVCTLDPKVIKEKAGGGADCMFDAGP
jgi:hypothetical protein